VARGALGDANDDPPVVGAAEVAPRRVIIVDDNVDAAESLRAVLEMNGHTVEVAFDADALLAAIEPFAPDVLLLDIDLPGLDGYQLARRVRSLRDGDRLVLIAVTGWGKEGDHERAREAGFDEHMTKPVLIEALEAAIARRRT